MLDHRTGVAATLLTLTLALPVTGGAQEGFGGAQDNGLVRQQAAYGYVPPPESFSVEGMLSEHHFPVREERCPEAMCVFAAMGHGLHRASLERSAYLLLEPVSGIHPAEHRRSPMNVGLVIDVSGSMSGDKIGWAKASAHALIDRLGPGDRLSIVTFDEAAHVIAPSAAVRDRARLHAIVEDIALGGSTDIHRGLSEGFAQIAQERDASRVDRLFVLTDEQPNTGATDDNSFLELVGGWAARGVSLTVVGVGLDLGAGLARTMSQLEGGATFYIGDAAGVDALFGEAFDQHMTPVARRLALTVRPGPGLRVAEVHGVPEEQLTRQSDGSVTLRAATLFLDARRSGAIVRLAPIGSDEAVLQARAEVDYQYVREVDQARQRGTLSVHHAATRSDSLAEFEAVSHYRAYALSNFAGLLRAALTHWRYGRRDEARRILGNARAGLDVDARTTDDPELVEERELADTILINMHRGRATEYAAR